MKKIEKITGKCYDTVRKTLVYGTRKNKAVIEAAKKLSSFNTSNNISNQTKY